MTVRLTRRQREVLLLAANGNSNADIGRWLGVRPDAVAALLTAVYRQLGVRDRAQAAAVALRLGVLELDEIHVPEPILKESA